MEIRNVRGYALEIAATFQVVEHGETVEVPDDLGASLCEQPANWEPVKAPKIPAAGGKSKED